MLVRLVWAEEKPLQHVGSIVYGIGKKNLVKKLIYQRQFVRPSDLVSMLFCISYKALRVEGQ